MVVKKQIYDAEVQELRPMSILRKWRPVTRFPSSTGAKLKPSLLLLCDVGLKIFQTTFICWKIDL